MTKSPLQETEFTCKDKSVSSGFQQNQSRDHSHRNSRDEGPVVVVGDLYNPSEIPSGLVSFLSGFETRFYSTLSEDGR